MEKRRRKDRPISLCDTQQPSFTSRGSADYHFFSQSCIPTVCVPASFDRELDSGINLSIGLPNTQMHAQPFPTKGLDTRYCPPHETFEDEGGCEYTFSSCQSVCLCSPVCGVRRKAYTGRGCRTTDGYKSNPVCKSIESLLHHVIICKAFCYSSRDRIPAGAPRLSLVVNFELKGDACTTCSEYGSGCQFSLSEYYPHSHDK